VAKILKYPYPFKAWFTLTNDPDNTVINDWQELHDFIWDELNLPFGDSLFVRSFNHNLKDQVNLEDYPNIVKAHDHDTLHTWGDYMHGRKRGFDRVDAEEAAAILEENNIQPRVWTDHAQFTGNMIHNSSLGSRPKLYDLSKTSYINFSYTLDIVQRVGVRYLWNGEITNIIAQNRHLKFNDFHLHSSNIFRSVLKWLLNDTKLGGQLFKRIDNRQYRKNTFADGSELYCFVRYGKWEHTDVEGLYQIIKPSIIDELISLEGTCAVYSHLGKRNRSREINDSHIPENTRKALKYVRDKYDSGVLMLSSVSDMLDYLVIRDNITINHKHHIISFNSDNIRYKQLSPADLKDKKFSFYKKGIQMDRVQVQIDGKNVSCQLVDESTDVFSVLYS